MDVADIKNILKSYSLLDALKSDNPRDIGQVTRKQIHHGNVLILGGDGYLGWPAAMYFSARGHDVTVVDNGFGENSIDLNLRTLYPVPI